ncbi:IclR family transcriptional regulator C-terminal domain-containing protein [Streptomyces sp. AC555_RSS877]|uniref:IclR family transcriptional regulator domain-containing protein n=1 Tax=Streptomyces sp. AC555_RSS877 TaxID=2823688 RepID=UPI0035ABF555
MPRIRALPPALPAVAQAPPPEAAVAPLMRGISVLRALTDIGGAASLSELGRATGLARATVDRVTGTLAHMGYVRLGGSSAVLAPRLMELGNAYLAALRLPDLLGTHADSLADALDESVSLAVADGDGIRFIHQAIRRRTLSLSFRIGDLLPVERTAPGPLLATEWDTQGWALWEQRQIDDPENRGFPTVPPRPQGGATDFRQRVEQARARGWVLDDQLIEPGLVAVSVPVRAPDGRIVCVASLVSHTSRHSAASLRESLLPSLRGTARVMEQELAGSPPSEPLSAPSDLAAWASTAKQELGGEFITSLARGLTVVTAFGEGRAELTLSEVAETTGLPRATARRALITLEHLGYVTRHQRGFRLAPRVLSLGFPPLSKTSLARIAHPHLVALTGRVQDSTSLAVLTGDDVQFAVSVAAGRIMDADIAVGARLPAHATSTGRVLLANLPDEELSALLARTQMRALTPFTITTSHDLTAVLDLVREEGHALVDGTLEEGLRSVAVPVHDRDGSCLAAINVIMHSSRGSADECLTTTLPELRATAALIEADLHTARRFVRVPIV